jgi:enolase
MTETDANLVDQEDVGPIVLSLKKKSKKKRRYSKGIKEIQQMERHFMRASHRMARAVEKAGYKEGLDGDIVYAMDLAANSWFDQKSKLYELDGKTYDREALIALYKEMNTKYPIASMEDPLHEEDFEGFAQLTRELDNQIVGDDLFVTNVERLRKGIEFKAANALLFKVNQIGSLSEALDAAEFAYRHHYGVQVSERSGETEDPIISDLVVALNSGQIKTGMPVRGERTSKHNRLLQIEEELGATATYAGRNFTCPA